MHISNAVLWLLNNIKMIFVITVDAIVITFILFFDSFKVEKTSTLETGTTYKTKPTCIVEFSFWFQICIGHENPTHVPQLKSCNFL